MRVKSASVSSTGVSKRSKPCERDTAAKWPKSQSRARRSGGGKSRVPRGGEVSIIAWASPPPFSFE